MKQKIIFDTDNTFGVPARPIDDGQAILYALGRDDLEIVGITTTHGNSSIDHVYDATRWLISHSGSPDIPVIKGASGPGDYHTPAAAFLAETVDAAPGEITVVAIGTMSNLHGASMIDPGFFGKVKQITAMGGYCHRLPVRGWNNIAEVNLSRDPKASYTLLYSEAPLILFDAHVCFQVPFGLRELRRWHAFDRRAYYLQLDYLLSHINELTEPVDYLWDLLPVVYLSYPELFNQRQVALKSTEEDLKTGTMRYDLNDGAAGRIITVPDYITDIDACYEVMYEAWERSPLNY